MQNYKIKICLILAITTSLFALSPEEEMKFLTSLQSEISIPTVRVFPLDPNASLLTTLNNYFEEAISCYSPEIQSFLKNAYYTDAIQKEVVGLQRKTGNFAQLSYTVDRNATEPLHFTVSLDASIAKDSLFRRISLIHEIAAHLGQRLEWSKKVGLDFYLQNTRRPAFHAFLEMTAFNLEKTIVDSMPELSVEKDIQESISDPLVKKRALKKYAIMRTSIPETVAYERWKSGYVKKYGDIVTLEVSQQFNAAYRAQSYRILPGTRSYLPLSAVPIEK